jgi:hypothetical protein
MIDSTITVTTPATDRNLLTIAQLRDIAGVTDSSKDTALLSLGARVSAMITKACGVARDGETPPTLLSETITQVTRLDHFHYRNVFSDERPLHKLLLLRRPVTSVASVIVDGETIDTAFYVVKKTQGALVRLNSDDVEIPWCGRKITISFVAGFATVPDDLALAASQLAQILFWQDSRDPNVKMEVIDGLGRNEWFANPRESDAIPSSIMQMLITGGYAPLAV